MSHVTTPVYGLPRLLTVDETAEFLRVDRSTIYRLEREGELRSVRVGRRRRFRPDDLAAYLERSSRADP
jgi:excisionase family DNA binding protein